VNWLLWDLIKPQVSPLFFAAVVVSAWYGGLGPALFATLLASFASIYIFSDPTFSWQVGVADVLRVSVFFAVAVSISALSAARRRAETDLRAAHAGLEQRVEERTRELAGANQALREEIARRRQAQAELVEHQSRLRDLASEVVLAEQRERRRLAQHLHDQIGQVLALSQIRVARLRQSGAAEAMCDSLEGLLEEAIARTRSITCELSPPVLYELGLEAAVQWLAEQSARQSGVPVTVRQEGEAATVSEDVSVTLFQTVRELLANVTKHAGAKAATVRLRWTPAEVAVTVADDGIGFDPMAVSQRAVSDSFGLFSIRERLRHLGGRMDVDAAAGRGSRVTVVLPLAADGGAGASATAAGPGATNGEGEMHGHDAHPDPTGR
jgi:signal transduction histidine kinase